MNRDNEQIITEAAAWHAASTGENMDWEGFTAWLEAHPSHRRAYGEVALADAALDTHREALRHVVDESDSLRATAGRWKPWLGAAIAASLVIAIAVPQLRKSEVRVYETQGAARSVALADGSNILLAPRSRLTVSDRDQIELAGGAWFDIRHDAARPLTISAGEVTIGDIGTKFDVQATGRQVRVEVAEGAIRIAAAAMAQPVQLARGRGLLFDGERGIATVSKVASENAGEWRSGRLTYEAAPLSLVVADLSRYAAIHVTLPARLRNRPFSGTLLIGDGKTAIRDLSQVMDLELGRDGSGYRLSEHTH